MLNCAYSVISDVASQLFVVEYPVTAVPVNVPSAFNTLEPPFSAVYHPWNVNPVLLDVGIVFVVDADVLLISSYNLSLDFLIYAELIPLNVPPFDVPLNVTFALFM